MKSFHVYDRGGRSRIRFSSRLIFFSILACAIALRAAEEVISFKYDSALRVISADNGSGKRIEYAYDPAGNVVSRTVRNFTDTDGDGMDDAWEIANFGSMARDGQGDFDGDGATDLAEFLAGTNPKDGTSVLRVTFVKQSAIARVQWASQAGLRYRVQYTDSITTPAWKQLGDDVIAAGTTTQKDDPSGFGNQQRYYRLVVVP